ncbi:MAG: restriction endonuclease subunit S [Bacteroidetes bacterium]|nr:restriction endonuclease subunit S [Bacteroidota bacterium]
MRTEILKNITTKIGSGATPTGGQNAYHKEGISLIRSQNVLDFTFSKNGLVFIDERQAKELDNVSVKENDILLNITGDSIARVCIVPKDILPARVNQHVSIIRADDSVNNQYLFYYLQYLKPYLLKICGVGGTRNALTKEVIEELKISLSENQNEIAEILSALDSKIQLNNRINTELEAMAKTIYNYWFIQFDFPNEEGKPYKASGGEMEYNEKLKMEIPVGWTDGKLSEVANITMGQSPDGDSYNEEGEGMVFFQGSTDFNFRFPLVRMFTTAPSRIAQEEDVLLSVRAPVGTLNVANEKCCIGRGLAALNSKNEANSFVLYLMFYFKAMFDVQDRTGTTFGSIDKDTLHDLKFAKPPVELQKQFQSIVGKYDKMILTRSRETQELITLRDFLLPLLMNGQVKLV